MPKLKFYDVKARKSFMSDDFVLKMKGGRKFAVATSPMTGIKAHRIVAKDFQK